MPNESLFKQRIAGINNKRSFTFVYWIVIVLLLVVIGFLVYKLISVKPVSATPPKIWQVPELGKDVYYSDVANLADNFCSYLMVFHNGGFSNNLKKLKELCVPEYNEPLNYVIDNPALAALIQKKEVTSTTKIDPPTIAGIDKMGRIMVIVTGNITLNSARNGSSTTRYYKVTLVVIRVDNKLKIANAIWKLYDGGA